MAGAVLPAEPQVQTCPFIRCGQALQPRLRPGPRGGQDCDEGQGLTPKGVGQA